MAANTVQGPVHDPSELDSTTQDYTGNSETRNPGFGMNHKIARLASSWEYSDLKPEERQQLILKLHMQPDDKVDAFLGSLTYPDPYKEQVQQQRDAWKAQGNLLTAFKGGGKEALASAIDMTGQSLAGAGALAIPGVGPYLVGPAEAVAGVATNRLNRALELREGKWNGPSPGLDDILAGALPLGMRAARGIKTYAMSHTKNQIEGADTLNLERTDAYHKDILDKTTSTAEKDIKNQNAFDMSIDKRMQTREDQKVKALENARAKALQLREDYLAGRKSQQEYTDAVAEHAQARTQVPEAGTAGIDTPDFRADYNASNVAAAKAKPVATDSIRKTADELGVSMRQPVEPTQNPFRRVTDALSTWGAPTEATEAVSPILNAAGKPITSTIPGEAGGIPVERAVATHQKLGQIINSAKGEELGVAKRLYAEIGDTLQAHAATDPNAKEAITKYLDGQAGWRKAEALKEYRELFGPGKGYGYKQGGETEVKSGSIRTEFDKLMESKFFAGSFPGEQGQQELAQLQGALKLLPKTTIPINPGTPEQPGSVSVDVPPNRALNPNRPGFPQVPDAPKLPEIKIPEKATPEAGQLKIGPIIMGKMAGSQVGGLAGEATGVGTYKGIVGGGYAGGLTVAAPYLTSKLMLAGPKWEAAARNIIGQGPMNPMKAAALYQLARHPAVVRDLMKTSLGAALLDSEETTK